MADKKKKIIKQYFEKKGKHVEASDRGKIRKVPGSGAKSRSVLTRLQKVRRMPSVPPYLGSLFTSLPKRLSSHRVMPIPKRLATK
ncbi:hypothetical protein VTL71DRAFT_13468 [Oculimacula yallundae]|uniref:Uncharacterized protein n=1 Tax=Oculimacula yallundae TaxID=86028 RepID=A0ABR4CLQ5_9HELO